MASFTVDLPVFPQDHPDKYLDPKDKFRGITFLREEQNTATFRVVAENKLMAAARGAYYVKHIDHTRKIIVRRGDGKLRSWFTMNEFGEMEETTPD